jgi:4-amino-4-deoxy-L-arabinose transferase-like glycosyltransferase
MRNRTRPYIGRHDWANIDCCLAVARNYQRYGLIASRLAQNKTPYDAPPEERTYMHTSAPLRSVLVYFALEIYGDNAFSPRFAALMASMIGTACLFTFTRWLHGTRTATLALVFFAFTPMLVFYSAKLEPQVFGLPIIMLTLMLYWQWTRTRTRRYWAAFLVLGLVGALTTRRWYFMVSFLAIHALVFQGLSGLLQLRPIWVGTALGGLSWLGLGLWGQTGFLDGLFGGFVRRTSTNPIEPTPNWGGVVASNSIVMLTPTLVFLAGAGIWSLWRQKRLFSRDSTLTMLFLIIVLAYNGLFWQSTYHHEFSILLVLISIAPLGAIGYRHLLYSSGPPQRAWRAAMGVVLLTFFVGSLHWSISFHHMLSPEYYQWGRLINSVTHPGEVAATNVYNIGPYFSYYAERKVIFEVEPGDVFPASQIPDLGFYIYCGGDSQLSPSLESAISRLPHEYDSNTKCFLIDLQQ